MAPWPAARSTPWLTCLREASLVSAGRADLRVTTQPARVAEPAEPISKLCCFSTDPRRICAGDRRSGGYLTSTVMVRGEPAIAPIDSTVPRGMNRASLGATARVVSRPSAPRTVNVPPLTTTSTASSA